MSKFLLKEHDSVFSDTETSMGESLPDFVTTTFLKSMQVNINTESLILTIKDSISKLLNEGNYTREDIKSTLKTHSIESFINHIRRDAGIDFTQAEYQEIEGKDIPPQVKETLDAGVPEVFNATVGMLKNEKGDIVVNPSLKKALLEFNITEKELNSIVKYNNGDGLEQFKIAITQLIKAEEELYNWKAKEGTKKRKGEISKPYFIAGGGGGLALFRDYFLEEADLMIVPNKRWPNIDGIVTNKTKCPPAISDIIDDNGNINIENLTSTLDTAQKQGRKKVGLYLNFPNNPTGVRISPNQAQELNQALNSYEDIDINICLDDPYGAFAIEGKGVNGEYQVAPPLSYYIDTDKNVTLMELGSHGTKEAGAYGLRLAAMRMFTSNEKKKNLEKKISLAIRQTTSMSPSIPQLLYVNAILGSSNLEDIKKMVKNNPKELQYNISQYLLGRNDMINVMYDKLRSIKKAISNTSGNTLELITNPQESGEYTGGFFMSYNISASAKEKGFTAENIRQSCNNLGKEGCGVTVINGIIRITLMSGDPIEFANRLEKGIQTSKRETL